MTSARSSRAIKLCGTEQPDGVGRVLRAGPLSVEFDNGNLRYLRVGDVEVLRGLAFLVRDENWGTCIPTLSGLVVEQRPDSFSVSYRAGCSRAGQELSYVAASEAMVNIRCTLARAAEEGVIADATHRALVATAKATFFPERDYARLLAQGRVSGLPEGELAVLECWLPSGQINQKRLDALAMLEEMRDFLATDPPPAMSPAWIMPAMKSSAASIEAAPVASVRTLSPMARTRLRSMGPPAAAAARRSASS